MAKDFKILAIVGKFLQIWSYCLETLIVLDSRSIAGRK